MHTTRSPIFPLLGVLGSLGLAIAACGGSETEPAGVLDASVVHLADVVDRALVSSGSAPMAARQQLQWSFHQAQPAWKTLSSDKLPWLANIAAKPVDRALSLALSPPTAQRTMMLIGGLETELEGDLRLGDWEAVLIRARSSDRFAGITVAYNLDEEGALPTDLFFFFSTDQAPPIFNDGSEQSYAIPLRQREESSPDDRLTSLAVVAATIDPATIDILSIELVPRGAAFLDDYGSRHVVRDGETRSTLFAHTPAALSYTLRVPADGRLDIGLSAMPGSVIDFTVTASAQGSEPRELFAEPVAESDSWQQRSIDLSELAGQVAELTLSATSEHSGEVALWGAPLVAGTQGDDDRPNIIFYVIDGGGADLMSVYGYHRSTTPFLEQLAAEGALFERAFSNATWTQPSTASFLTSLQHSVLGGLRRGIHSTPIPAAATPMAEHMRRGGYQTASFSANPNSGRMIGAERGVDVMRDTAATEHSISSVELHEVFWGWRDAYPGGPYWTHFQTTDVHEPNRPPEPFAGHFVSAGEHQQLDSWHSEIFTKAGGLFGRMSIAGFYDLALERTAIPRQDYFSTRNGLYDETMQHQDHQLQEFVTSLKASGEWQNTLLVIGSDHGHPAGSFARWGRGLFEPQPEPWQGALFDAYASRVPLIFIWPGRIPGGQRFTQAVSMIDVLPTMLDLVGLPPPEVVQGQSLAPLLTGGSLELRPVIFDEFRIDDASGEMLGNLDIVDGRWGASLEIGPQPAGTDPDRGRYVTPAGGRWGAVHEYYPEAPRLLLYDLEVDPFARHAVNAEHPELVAKYGALLREQWAAHQALAERFGETSDITLTPEQLQQLRALGYIQ